MIWLIISIGLAVGVIIIIVGVRRFYGTAVIEEYLRDDGTPYYNAKIFVNWDCGWRGIAHHCSTPEQAQELVNDWVERERREHHRVVVGKFKP